MIRKLKDCNELRIHVQAMVGLQVGAPRPDKSMILMKLKLNYFHVLMALVCLVATGCTSGLRQPVQPWPANQTSPYATNTLFGQPNAAATQPIGSGIADTNQTGVLKSAVPPPRQAPHRRFSHRERSHKVPAIVQLHRQISFTINNRDCIAARVLKKQSEFLPMEQGRAACSKPPLSFLNFEIGYRATLHRVPDF